jgi:hypothetical protein
MPAKKVTVTFMYENALFPIIKTLICQVVGTLNQNNVGEWAGK